MTDDELVAYLAGEAETLPPSIRATTDGARLERTRKLLADPDVWVEPSPELEQRVLAAVAATTHLAPDHAPDPAPGPVAAKTQRTPARWVRNVTLGAAAAVLLAVGLATFVGTRDDQPVTFAAAMLGTDLAPGASGKVTMTQTKSGWRIHLQASGLPRLDGGTYYQGWLKDAAGNLVPIGTFNEPTDVTLWSGVPPSDFPTLTITRQQAVNGPASSGQKVLVGTTRRTH